MRYPARAAHPPRVEGMRPDAWTALRGRPWRFLASRWPWRRWPTSSRPSPIGLRAGRARRRSWSAAHRRRGGAGRLRDPCPGGFGALERRAAAAGAATGRASGLTLARAAARRPPAPGVVAGGRLRVPAGRSCSGRSTSCCWSFARHACRSCCCSRPGCPRSTGWRSPAGSVDTGRRGLARRRSSGVALAVVAAYVVDAARRRPGGARPAAARPARRRARGRRRRPAPVAGRPRRRLRDRAPPDRARPARRRAAAAGRAHHDARAAPSSTWPRVRALDLVRDGAPAGRGGARRAARHDARHPPAGARRPRARGGRARDRRPLAGPGLASTSGSASGCRDRSRRRRTSWSARRSPTSPGTPRRRRAEVHAWRQRRRRSC